MPHVAGGYRVTQHRLRTSGKVCVSGSCYCSLEQQKERKWKASPPRPWQWLYPLDGSCALPRVTAQGQPTPFWTTETFSAWPFLSPARARGAFCMKLLTQVNWEIGLERDKKTSDWKLRITPLILPLEDHFSNFLQEIAEGSHYPEKRGGMTIHVKPRCCPRAGQAGGQGQVFTGSFNQVPMF